MFRKGLFKACDWKLQFLTVLHLLSEQNDGLMDRLGLKQKNIYCLILPMFLQIYPPQFTWAVSTVSMQDCSLHIAALGL